MKSIRNVLAATLVAGGSVLAAAGGMSIARAQDTSTTTPVAPGTRGHGPHGWGPERLFSQLGLTTEQQASIKSIMTAARPQMKTLHERMHANHLKLMQTTPDDPNYASVVAEVAQSDAMLASQRTSQAAELRGQMYAVLTPAQKTQLAALEAQWAAQPHGPRGWHGPAGGAAPAAPAT